MGFRDEPLRAALLELILDPLSPTVSADHVEHLIQLGLASRWGNVVTVTRSGRLAAFADSQSASRATRARCKECEALVGQPTSTPPHGALVSDSMELRSDGDVERLRCRTCESRWERLLPNDTAAAKAPWRITTRKPVVRAQTHQRSPMRRTYSSYETTIRWRFFQGHKGEWRWYRFDENNDVIATSERAFVELPACMQNAERAGFDHTNYHVHMRAQVNHSAEPTTQDRSVSQH